MHRNCSEKRETENKIWNAAPFQQGVEKMGGRMNDLSSCLDSSLGRKLGFVTRRKRGGGIRFSERITRRRRGRQMRTMHADMMLQFLAIFHGYKRRRMSGSRSCFARWFLQLSRNSRGCSPSYSARQVQFLVGT